MVHPIRMPKPGQMTESCVLTLWRKAEGEAVHRGDVLFEIETDKSSMEVEAFDDGVLLRRLAAEGDEVPVNAIVAYVGEPGEAIPEAEAAVPQAAETAADVAPARVPVMAAGRPAGAGVTAEPAGGRRLRISPRASRLALEAGLDPSAIAGTGPEGRVVERDVRAAIEARGTATAAPVARAATPRPAGPEPRPDPAGEGEEPPVPLSRMRRTIAERLTLSATTIPAFTVTASVDVTALLALRDERRASGTTLSVTDFVLSAVAHSLAEFPDVNARTDGRQVWPRPRVNLGIAVSLPAGLIVPVVRDADRLSILELHDRATAVVARARAGSLRVDELTGGTFTVSNLGMFGVDEFSAIINPGESAILAVGSAIPSPVVIGGGIAVRSIMRLTLSADHRQVDGELGARFLNAIRRRLEDGASLRRELAGG